MTPQPGSRDGSCATEAHAADPAHQPPAPGHPPASGPDPAQLFLDRDQSAYYAAHRPHYPAAMYDTVYDAAMPGRRPPFGADSTVVDVATGSGQGLGPMPADFGRCIALDVSPAQLAALPPQLAERVTAHVGDAHATGLPDACADLVTVGQALHWFRLGEFYREARRILKPTGALAAWSYDFGRLYGFPGANELYVQLYQGTLGPYWARGRELVDRHYEGIEPGPEHFGAARREQLPMDVESSLEHLVGQLRSWSGYRSYTKAHPDQPDPVDAFQAAAAARMAAEGSNRVTLRRTLTVLLALRPRAL